MNIGLKDSFDRAEQVNREQESKLQDELNLDVRVVDTMIQEIMWGSSANSIKFDARRDFGIDSKDADLYYKQALQAIKENRKWYKR